MDMSDNTMTGDVTITDSQILSADNANDFRRSELLCFIADKQRSMPYDHLVKVCTDFYRDDEIIAARNLLSEVTGRRLTQRKGSDMKRSTVQDIVKVMLNPTTELPRFYAMELARLPPVDITHCDVSAILQELQSLRSEVREISNLKAEIDTLRKRSEEIDQLRCELVQMKQACDASSSLQQFQPALAMKQITNASKVTYASVANSVPSTEIQRMQKKPQTAVVVGKSSNNKRVKTVITKRNIDIFVTRLHPATEPEEVENCVMDVKPDLNRDDISCTRLKSKFESLYSSYHVAVTVDSTCMKSAIDTLMASESWPEGLLVRRYFKPRNNNNDE